MIEIITIKMVEDELYLGEFNGGSPVFTMNLRDIMSFPSLESAEQFAKEYLDEIEFYEIVNLKIDFKINETTLKTINF